MRLEPLYRIRFAYPESWAVGLDGGWQQLFFIAEGHCEGAVTGQRPLPAGPLAPSARARARRHNMHDRMFYTSRWAL